MKRATYDISMVAFLPNVPEEDEQVNTGPEQTICEEVVVHV